MLRGELDISQEAIGLGLARNVAEHYQSANGALPPEREIIIDNCRFTITILAQSTSRKVERIFLTASRSMSDEEFRTSNLHPEFEGVPLGLAAYCIDLEERTARFTVEQSGFALNTRQCDLIRHAVEQILLTELEELLEELDDPFDE